MDKAVEYSQKVTTFVDLLNKVNTSKSTWQVETGRKFDRVFENTGTQRLGRYMVCRNSWTIFGIKSWAQVNPRRSFGTLDTVDQYMWGGYTGSPKPGSEAEKVHLEAEAKIAAGYKKRGRPRKNP